MEKLGAFFQTSPVDVATAGHSLWMIIALPLLGAFICGVFGKIIGRANTHIVALSSVAGSLLLSVVCFWATVDPYATNMTYAIGFDYGTWFSAGTFRANLGLSVDHLSGSMLMVITGIGFLIHLYSTGYMSHDAGYWRFFAYLNLFIAAMLTLVLADSLPLLFVGWEGVGMCSYLLIGFWYDDAAKAFAGRKAFITNRIGDFGFIVASFLMVMVIDAIQVMPVAKLGSLHADGVTAVANLAAKTSTHGTLSFGALEDAAKMLPALLNDRIPTGPLHDFTFGGVVTAALLLFLLGAAGKSAQFPLYVWLPDAMAGPTPVSALIHAATMVTSGIYLFCRISYLAVLSPQAMAVIALIGGITALWAALIAFSQTGLKKVLAYSTVSQLGLMFVGIGAGAFWAAFLHVVTHAFFKACLFLGAGSVMHGNADEEDATKLGGLRKAMPWTWGTFAIATVAITGVIPLSGFFSKDAIIDAAHEHQIPAVPWALPVAYTLAVATALGTAFYMWRLYWLTFEGERAKDAKIAHAHESSWVMTMPLVILAAGSVLLMSHGIPFMHSERGGHEVRETLMENFLDPVFRTTYENMESVAAIKLPEAEGLPWSGWITAWVIALTGFGASYWLYRIFFPSRGAQALPGPWEAARRFSFNKFFVDEVYNKLLIRPLVVTAKYLWRFVDTVIIDTVAVRGSAWVTERAGFMLRYVQTGDAQGYAAVMVLALAAALIWALMRVTT